MLIITLMNSINGYVESIFPKPLAEAVMQITQLAGCFILFYYVTLPLVLFGVVAFWDHYDLLFPILQTASPALLFVVPNLAWGAYWRSCTVRPESHHNFDCWAARFLHTCVVLTAIALLWCLWHAEGPVLAKVAIFLLLEWIALISVLTGGCPNCPSL